MSLTVLAAAACFLAAAARFIQDDAFISFRYARNLVEGHGLVFNPGERVEGYTNFLWTLWNAIPQALGWDPVAFAQWSGIAALFPLVWATGVLGRKLSDDAAAGFLAAALLATNYTVLAFASGGMEVVWQALFVTLAFVLRPDSRAPAAILGPLRLAAFSASLNAALLTRPDSAIPAAILFPPVLIAVWRHWPPGRFRSVRLAALLAPCLPTAGWLVWKASFYGELVPNTWHAKDPGLTALVGGAWYVGLFFLTYGWFILAPFLVGGRLGRAALSPRDMRAVVWTLALWFAYLVKMGGDFMEFRLFVPVMPLLCAVLARMLLLRFERAVSRAAAIALLVAGSGIHAALPRLGGVETVRGMHGHLEGEKWEAIGRRLGADLGGSGAILAVTAAGAIPFYSGLPTVDMLGLSDRWVARSGAPVRDRRPFLGPKPGHQRIATLEYLVSRGVNLLIGHPRLVPAGTTADSIATRGFFESGYLAIPLDGLPDGVRALVIPVDADHSLAALCLRSHPGIEAALAGRGWTAAPLQDGAAPP